MIVRGAQSEAELEIVADMQMAAFAPTGMVLAFRPRRLERLRKCFAPHQTRLVEDEGQIVALDTPAGLKGLVSRTNGHVPTLEDVFVELTGKQLVQ